MRALVECPPADAIRQFLLGQTPPPDADQLEQHLTECSRCLVVAQAMQPTDVLLETVQRTARRGLVGALPADASLIDRACRLHRPTPSGLAPDVDAEATQLLD